MAPQMGSADWKPAGDCFPGNPMYDTGFGFQLPRMDLRMEVCALVEEIKFIPYLDWSELAAYATLWTFIWLVSQYVLRVLIYEPLAYRFLPVPNKVVTASGKVDKPVAVSAPGVRHRGGKHADGNGHADGSASGRPSDRDVLRFVTACSRFVNYSVAFVSCMYVLSLQDWSHDTAQYWIGYPQMIEPSSKHYYYFYIGFYLHQMVVLFYEPKLKDFYVMVTHHIVTILLVVFSFCTGYYRIGLPIMAVHDVSDPVLEIAKAFNYCKAKVGRIPAADILFVVFAITFFASRLVYYPRYLLWTVLWESPIVWHLIMGIWLYFFLLLTLQVLHVYWMFLISKMVVLAIVNNGVQGDVREEED